jgi:hypothetical protein
LHRLAKARYDLSTCKVTFCSTDLQRHDLVYQLAKSHSVLQTCKGTVWSINLQSHILLHRLAKALSGLSTCKVTFCSTDFQSYDLVHRTPLTHLGRYEIHDVVYPRPKEQHTSVFIHSLQQETRPSGDALCTQVLTNDGEAGCICDWRRLSLSIETGCYSSLKQFHCRGQNASWTLGRASVHCPGSRIRLPTPLPHKRLPGYQAVGTPGFMPPRAQLCQVQDIFMRKRFGVLNELNK